MRRKKILLVMPINQSTVLPAFTRALSYLRWEYRVFDYRKFSFSEKLVNWSGDSELAVESMNRRLVNSVKEWQPKLVFVVKGSVISPEALREIKDIGALTVNWFPDDIQAYGLVKQIIDGYDIFCHFDSFAVRQLKKDFSRKTIYHFSFGADILPDDPAPNFSGYRKYDLTMVGNYYPIREKILPKIGDLGLHIWGDERWKKTVLSNNYHGWLPFEDLFDVFRKTKIGINLQYPSPSWSLVNRAYDIMTCGTMLLTEDKQEVANNFIETKEVVVFRNDKDLRLLAIDYLKDTGRQRKVAKEGYKRVRTSYTYVHRFKDFFKYLDFK